MIDDPWTCEDCGDHLGPDETLCEECADIRYEAWIRHQDWLRMSDKEREDAIHWHLM